MRGLTHQRRRWVFWGVVLLGTAILLVSRPRGPSKAELWMAARRATGEKFTLDELGWDHRPVFASPVMDVLAAHQSSLRRYLALPGPTKAFVPQSVSEGPVVLWKEPHMTSAAAFQAPWVLMEDQLDIVEPALDEVRASLQTIVHDPGGSYTDLTRTLDYIAIRETAQLLADSVILELHREQPGQALTNLVSLIRLSRQHDQLYGLVNQMIRVALTGLALDMTWQALQWPGWSDAQLQAVQAELAQVSLLDPYFHTIQAERAAGLYWHKTLTEEGSAGLARLFPGAQTAGFARFYDQLHTMLWQRFWSEADLLFFLEHYQTQLDSTRGLMRAEAWAPLLQSINRAPDPGDQLTRRFLGMRYTFALFSALAIPNDRRALDTVARTECRRRLAILAIAVERYRASHGEAPAGLEVLVPGYLDRLPQDPYSAQPFRFLRGTPRPTRIYSVGVDGIDDGGSTASDPPATGPGSSGRDLDVVWPLP